LLSQSSGLLAVIPAPDYDIRGQAPTGIQVQKLPLKGLQTGFPLTACGNDELFSLFLLIEILFKEIHLVQM